MSNLDDFDDNLDHWRDTMPEAPRSRPLALRRKPQPMLDALLKPEPETRPFDARGLRRRT